MDLALIIAIVALAVAIPGTIDATWNVIAKIRALKKDAGVDTLLLKKSKKLRLDGVTNQTAKSLRKSKKEGDSWLATEAANAMRLARRVMLRIFNGESSGAKKRIFFSQEDFDETSGPSLLKKVCAG